MESGGCVRGCWWATQITCFSTFFPITHFVTHTHSLCTIAHTLTHFIWYYFIFCHWFGFWIFCHVLPTRSLTVWTCVNLLHTSGGQNYISEIRYSQCCLEYKRKDEEKKKRGWGWCKWFVSKSDPVSFFISLYLRSLHLLVSCLDKTNKWKIAQIYIYILHTYICIKLCSEERKVKESWNILYT